MLSMNMRYFQHEYFVRHPEGVDPVQLNDAIFSLHAVVACAVTIVQCAIYEVNYMIMRIVPS